MMNSRPTKKPEQRGPFRQLRQGMNRVFGSRWFMMASSLLAAIVAWALLMASDGTLVRQKSFASVSVGVIGGDALKSRGYIVTDNVNELIPNVRMTVEVSQNNYTRATSAIYNPHIDLSSITGEGEVTVPISFTSQIYGPVTYCEPSSVTVHVDRYYTRRIPVVVEQIGELPEGIYLDSYRTDPTMLSVSGPASLVSGISRAVVRLDRSELSMDRMADKTALRVELQTATGEVVDSSLVQITNQTVITDSVVVETEIVPMKLVAVDPSTMISGQPYEGFEIVEVRAAQPSLAIAASQEVLDSVETITCDIPLNIQGAFQDIAGYARMRRVSGLKNNFPLDLEVSVKIREQTIERTFRSVELEVDGLSDDLRATLSSERMTVQLTGGYYFINNLKKEDIRLYVDASGLEEGTHELPVQIHIDNTQEFSCALSTPQVNVKIRSK